MNDGKRFRARSCSINTCTMLAEKLLQQGISEPIFYGGSKGSLENLLFLYGSVQKEHQTLQKRGALILCDHLHACL